MQCPELLGGAVEHTVTRRWGRLAGEPAAAPPASVASPLGKEGLLRHRHLKSQPREKMDPAGQRARPETDPILGSRGSGDTARLETDPIHARHFGLRVSGQRLPPRNPGPESQLSRSAAVRLWTSGLCLDVSLLACGGGDGGRRAAQGRRGHSKSQEVKS